MKLVISPPVSDERLQKIIAAAGPMRVVNAASEDQAAAEIADADALFGYLTPRLLHAAKKLRWAQSPTASMEKYLYPGARVDSPVVVTNMRGIFSDVIADHVFGFILCFAKNFHIYIRQQMRAEWHMLGQRRRRTAGLRRPRRSASVRLRRHHARRLHARRHRHGGHRHGNRTARPGVRHARPRRRSRAVSESGVSRHAISAGAACMRCCRKAISWSSPRRTRRRRSSCSTGERIRQMKRSAYLINVGRGVIVDLADLTAALASGGDRGGGAGRFRDRAVAEGASVMAHGERDHHAALRRRLAASAGAASADAAGKPAPLRRGAAAVERGGQADVVLSSASRAP